MYIVLFLLAKNYQLVSGKGQGETSVLTDIFTRRVAADENVERKLIGCFQPMENWSRLNCPNITKRNAIC